MDRRGTLVSDGAFDLLSGRGGGLGLGGEFWTEFQVLRLLPRERVVSKVAVLGGRLVDRSLQVEIPGKFSAILRKFPKKAHLMMHPGLKSKFSFTTWSSPSSVSGEVPKANTITDRGLARPIA